MNAWVKICGCICSFNICMKSISTVIASVGPRSQIGTYYLTTQRNEAQCSLTRSRTNELGLGVKTETMVTTTGSTLTQFKQPWFERFCQRANGLFKTASGGLKNGRYRCLFPVRPPEPYTELTTCEQTATSVHIVTNAIRDVKHKHGHDIWMYGSIKI